VPIIPVTEASLNRRIMVQAGLGKSEILAPKLPEQKKNQKLGSSSRTLVLKAQSHEFKSQYCEKIK
jgi:hypothetical protein